MIDKLLNILMFCLLKCKQSINIFHQQIQVELKFRISHFRYFILFLLHLL